MESDTHLLYFTKISGKSQDFYSLVGIHLNGGDFLGENNGAAPALFVKHPRAQGE